MWLRMMRNGNFAYVDDCLVYKRTCLNYRIPWERWMNDCKVMYKIISVLSKEEFKKLNMNLNYSASKVYSCWGSYLLHTGNRAEARKYLLKALRMKFKPKIVLRYFATYMPLGFAKLFDGIYLRELRERSKMKRLGLEDKR